MCVCLQPSKISGRKISSCIFFFRCCTSFLQIDTPHTTGQRLTTSRDGQTKPSKTKIESHQVLCWDDGGNNHRLAYPLRSDHEELNKKTERHMRRNSKQIKIRVTRQLWKVQPPWKSPRTLTTPTTCHVVTCCNPAASACMSRYTNSKTRTQKRCQHF